MRLTSGASFAPLVIFFLNRVPSLSKHPKQKLCIFVVLLMYSYGGIWHFVWDEERGEGRGADSALSALTSIFLAPYYHPCQSHHHPHYNFPGGICEHQNVIKGWFNAITTQLLVGWILLTWSITAKESKTCWKEEANMNKIEIRMGWKRQHDAETKLKHQAKQKGIPVVLGEA